MDLSNMQPVEEGPTPRDQQSRTASPASRDSSTAPEVKSVSENPEHGGILASSEVSGGEVRDAAAGMQTRDRASKLQGLLAEITKHAGLPGYTDVSIEVDRESRDATFLIHDKETGELLRRVPEDEALTIAAKLSDSTGILVDRKV